MNPKVLIIVLFAVAAGGIFWFTQKKAQVAAVEPSQGAGAAKQGAPRTTVEISVLYSTEKKEWLEAANEAFKREHPEIGVTLTGKGSFEAAQALADGREKPTVWSPADSLALALGGADFETKNGAPLFAAEGQADAPTPLLITPLVWVVWEDRAEALVKTAGGKLDWKIIRDAVASNQGWPAVGGKAEWGFVKLGHTDPTRSNSGLQALLSMSFEFEKKTAGLTVADVLDPKLQAWLQSLEKGVTKFELSTGTFMTDMVRFGPSRYDIAVVYESLAVAQIENAQGRWGNLKIYYPATTLWSDHPGALLKGAWVTAEQAKAGRQWLAFLRSRPMQELALAYGFRPADPAVPLKSADARNPFTRLAPYGLQLDLPQAATLPDAAVVRNLMTLWSRTATAR
jgi:Bacterial extracellular solute-binding protein